MQSIYVQFLRKRLARGKIYEHPRIDVEKKIGY